MSVNAWQPVWRLLPTLASAAAIVLFGAAAAAAPDSAESGQTRSWVISYWTIGVASDDRDCPRGLNPQVEKVWRQALTQDLGKTSQEADQIVVGKENDDPEKVNLLVNRGRIDGKPVNIYTHPMAGGKRTLYVSEGPYAYGFNLDGKGAGSPNSFQDPETRQPGVNNQYARAVGCFMGQRAYPPARSTYWEYVWSALRDTMPAWLITLTVDNPATGDGTLRFEQALEHVSKDANTNVRRDSTFRVDPASPRQNVFHVKVVDNVITLNDGELYLRGDPYMVARMHLTNTHARLKIKPDGSLDGAVGGYQPWLDIYYMYGSSGWSAESMIGVDVPAMYQVLRDQADADPDPQSGRNQAISAGYRVEAVPAFIEPFQVATRSSR